LVSNALSVQHTVYIGLVGRFTLEQLPPELAQLASTGLTRIDSDGSPIAGAAERWVVEDEGKTYRFLLRQNMLWHDGKLLIPDDITVTLPDVSVFTTPNEVIFKLKEPFAPFPSLLVQPMFRHVPAKRWGIIPHEKLIGLGKYTVEQYTLNGTRLTQVTLLSKTERRIYRFYSTEEEARLAFIRGEVDMIPNLADIGELAKWPQVAVTHRVEKNAYLAVFFNTQFPLFGSNELRQALNYALPKPDGEARATGPYNPDSWAYANISKPYTYDLERAIERLLKAPPREPITFELTTTPLFVNDAERIRSAWVSFGREAQARCLESNEVKEKELCANMLITPSIRLTNFPNTDDFQALLIGQRTGDDPDQYALWHSQARTNFTHYSNTRIDT
jgi:peptide/nickel transport system substrate-binding protein